MQNKTDFDRLIVSGELKKSIADMEDSERDSQSRKLLHDPYSLLGIGYSQF